MMKHGSAFFSSAGKRSTIPTFLLHNWQSNPRFYRASSHFYCFVHHSFLHFVDFHSLSLPLPSAPVEEAHNKNLHRQRVAVVTPSDARPPSELVKQLMLCKAQGIYISAPPWTCLHLQQLSGGSVLNACCLTSCFWHSNSVAAFFLLLL